MASGAEGAALPPDLALLVATAFPLLPDLCFDLADLAFLRCFSASVVRFWRLHQLQDHQQCCFRHWPRWLHHCHCQDLSSALVLPVFSLPLTIASSKSSDFSASPDGVNSGLHPLSGRIGQLVRVGVSHALGCLGQSRQISPGVQGSRLWAFETWWPGSVPSATLEGISYAPLAYLVEKQVKQGGLEIKVVSQDLEYVAISYSGFHVGHFLDCSSMAGLSVIRASASSEFLVRLKPELPLYTRHW